MKAKHLPMLAPALREKLVNLAEGLGVGMEVAVDVRLSGQGQALHVVIENTGSLEPNTKSRRRPGIGLENVRRRLALHYPGRYQFSLHERGGPEPKVVARLTLEGEPCGS